MSVGLYMDVHVSRLITRSLRRRAVDVLTAQEDGTARWEDPELLVRATQLNRILFSQDEDLLVEAAQRQRTGELFSGLIYSPQLALPITKAVDDLELVAKASQPDDDVNRVIYLPLR